MIKGILIDLGGTVIENNNFSFNRLFKKVYELNNNKKISYEEYERINKHLISITYDKRKEKEVRFIDYLRYLQQYLKLSFDKSLEEIEKEAVLSITNTEIIDDVIKFLSSCKDRNFKIVAVSNTTFSKTVVLEQLRLFDLEKYFDDILLSSEYLFRKPSIEFYNLAVKTIDLEIDEIIFIGNDYKCDIIGPYKLGIKTYWLNKSRKQNDQKINTIEFIQYQEIINKINS